MPENDLDLEGTTDPYYGINVMVPEAHGHWQDQPWWQKAIDIGSLPARYAWRALGQPILDIPQHVIEASEGALYNPNLLQDPHAQHQLTGALIDMAMLGRETPGLPAFPAWHGSRHLFAPDPANPLGRFMEEKMSTGEGGQAYAWGHYLGGARKTAETYKQAGGVSDDSTIMWDGKPYKYNDVLDDETLPRAASYSMYDYGSHGGDFGATMFFLRDAQEKYLNRVGRGPDFYRNILANEDPDWHKMTPKKQEEAVGDYIDFEREEAGKLGDQIDWMRENKDKLSYGSPGHLYQVWIHPEKHELLDWDKPFSEQPPKVQEILKKNFPGEARAAEIGDPTRTGGEIYKNIASNRAPSGAYINPGEREASEALDAAGIPGVRFLDGFSRHLPKVMNLDEKPWVPASETEQFVHGLVSGGKVPPKWRTNDLQWGVDQARNSLEADLTTGYFGNASRHLPPKPGYHPDREAQTRDALDWIENNRDKLTMGDHPDATHNYVIFHNRHLHIIDRDGQHYGLSPVDHNPFETVK